jgi:uncharacterized protein DUF4962/heparinase II/III-like protein
MQFPPLLFAGLLAAATSLGAQPKAADAKCGAQQDFLVRSDPLLAPVRPTDCLTLTQSPPEFTWPAQGGNTRFTYTLALTHPDGHTETRATTQNWLAWDKVLPPGDYTWTLKSAPNHEVGQPRRFTIAPNAIPFLLPTDEALLRQARSTPRPRSWPGGRASPLLATRAERAVAFARLLEEVDGKMHLPVEAEPKAGSKNANYDATVNEQKRTLNSALAWAATRQGKYGDDGVRRLMAMAAWNVSGPISFRNNDMASRNVAWTLALGYDWMHDRLTAEQKAAILETIRMRTRDMYNEYIATGEITKSPYDSHGNLTLTIMAAIAALVAGDIPDADKWLVATGPMAIAWTSPWGNGDGGFGNGTTQGLWDTGSNLLAWYVLKNATGIDVAKKEWVRNHSRYLAYFIPPATAGGAFGDGHEQDHEELQARVGKALAAFSPTPLARWYASQLKGEDTARLELLLAPRPERGAAPFPPDTPSSAYFPSIGWVAMHSSLADPLRTSVYFKSSPYGSYNHSHADQNSFVINHRGERLAIASGYYDDYRTPHWSNWYKQTRAKNAITFDGGVGQGHDGKQYYGEITRFESRDTFDYAVGHAQKAYAGMLTRAQRSLVYLKPGVVLVYDHLSAPMPRLFEWNIHALHKMQKFSETRISIVSGKAHMCVEMLASPAVAFNQHDRFPTPPQRNSMADKTPNQWHGAFAMTSKATDAEFVALLRIGAECPVAAAPTAVARRTTGGWQVAVDGKTVTLSGDAVSVN